ncbi:hypothetical protein GE09DRAFT_1223213 [Coniochaeta sp. 2T2.1]|nr:hypothetical protein GE09DRAFT_1223213 [Coniochaeta sp. 2T2.1]
MEEDLIDLLDGPSTNGAAAPPPAPSPRPPVGQDRRAARPNARLRDHISPRNKDFSSLKVLRQQGWRDPAADEYYAEQRALTAANNPGTKLEYFEQRCEAAEELDRAARCMTIAGQPVRKALKEPKIEAILDLCFAPGGLAVTAMKANPQAYMCGITLFGGTDIMTYHRNYTNANVTLDFHDVNTLVGAMGFKKEEIDPDYLDTENFIFGQKFPRIPEFDLVFCGGATKHDQDHERPTSDSVTDCLQLTLSQLLIATNRISEGGTMVVLLHRPETWITCQLIYMISKFAKINLFKPRGVDRMYKTFYLVAKEVKPKSSTAQDAVNKWKKTWQRLMFDMPNSRGIEDIIIAGKGVDNIIAEFGEQLLKLGAPVWFEQAEALKNPPWKKEAKKDEVDDEEVSDDEVEKNYTTMPITHQKLQNHNILMGFDHQQDVNLNWPVVQQANNDNIAMPAPGAMENKKVDKTVDREEFMKKVKEGDAKKMPIDALVGGMAGLRLED